MRKLILLAPLLLCLNAHAINLFDGMVTMALVEYNGTEVKADGSYGILMLTHDFAKEDLLPLISFTSFKFERWDNGCIPVRSDISEMFMEGKIIKLRGRDAVSATGYLSEVSAIDIEHLKRDAYKYGHSFLLTTVDDKDDASDGATYKYRLEVTRYFDPERIRKPIVWIYESRTPFIDEKKSPCAGKFNY